MDVDSDGGNPFTTGSLIILRVETSSTLLRYTNFWEACNTPVLYALREGVREE